jgi:hypothetical protein
MNKFLEKFYPNYSSCPNIALLNDYQVILDGEMQPGSNAEAVYNSVKAEMEIMWKGGGEEVINYYTAVEIEKLYNELSSILMKQALDNFEKNEEEFARNILEEKGYYVDNLWCAEDVYSKVEEKISQETALGVLNKAFENDATYMQLWMSIDAAIEDEGLTLKKD